MLSLYHIIDAIFPKQCFNCHKIIERVSLICEDCLKKIPINNTLFCSLCRARLANNKKICHRQQKYLLAAATAYSGLAKELIWQFKYGKKTSAGHPLGAIASEYLNNLGLEFKNFSVVPIALHKKRQRQRGFNQAEILAKAISKKLSLPLLTGALTRIKETSAQMKLESRESRYENLKDAFMIPLISEIDGKNILLVDDVVTSGATFNEAVRALKNAGAKKIIALAVAKAGT